jgi:hypothetical protein
MAGAARLASGHARRFAHPGLDRTRMERARGTLQYFSGMERIVVQFLTLLAITYLSARRGKQDSHFRQALMWAGGLALLPLSAVLGAGEWVWYGTGHPLPLSLQGLAVLAAEVESKFADELRVLEQRCPQE